MNHWLVIAAVIEAAAVLAWIASSATRQVRFAFLFGFNVMLPVACLHLTGDGPLGWRGTAALASVVLYLIYMNVVILLWTVDTAMSKLDRRLKPIDRNILPILLANAVGWLYCLPFAFVGRRAGGPSFLDAGTLAIYALGTVLHASGDIQKRRFKARPDTSGRILQSGLWRYSRHPNYFGDFLVYVAWALSAANPWAWLSPAANLAQYFFDAIPKSEAWAAERYGPAWRDYAARTSRFIPLPRRGTDA